MTETNWGLHGVALTPKEYLAWVDAGRPDLGGTYLADAANAAMRQAKAQAWDEGHSVGYHGESSDLNPYGKTE